MERSAEKEIAHEEHTYDEAIEMSETLRPVNVRNKNNLYGARANVKDKQDLYDDLHLPQSIGFKKNDTRWLKGLTVVLVAVTVVLIAIIIFLGIREGTDQSSPKVDGGWSTWGSLSECSASCGTGMASRNRSCSNPTPNNGGDHCLGDSTEYQLCNKFACPGQSLPKVDGGWSTWGSWSECSALCGTGMVSRKRSCSNPKSSNGGDHCFGDSTEYKFCNKLPCPVERNCKDLMDKGDRTTGFKIIVPDGINPVRVLCIMDVDGGGWTVFQKRESDTDFYKNWTEYRNGFGDDTNFWLGLENIHRLTAQGNYRLRVDMSRTNNQHAAAKYQTFSVGNETMLYKLSIGNYSFDPAFNDPRDSFSLHNGMKFTTYDKDNDADSSRHCALEFKGGYWYKDCHGNNLNGLYGSTNFSEGINWFTWTGYEESLKYTRMMIRPN